MKQLSIIGLCILLLQAPLFAQENIGIKPMAVHSPVVHGTTVDFSLDAPNARQVLIKGSWMMSGASRPMTKDSAGVWTFTARQLPSDLYTYKFIVDGVSIIDPSNVYVLRDVGSLFSMFITGGGKGDMYLVKDVPHGTVSYRWYRSPSLNMDRRVSIYTPPGYETGDKNYPVLYLLHGMGGDETAWLTLGRLAEIMDNLIAQEKAVPMIVVMPNGNVVQSAAPGASDKGFADVDFFLPHSMDGRFETSFKDVVAFTEQNYRVIKDKEHRAIAGLSMGGFHSLYISANYPSTFSYVGLFSPAVLPLNRIQGHMPEEQTKYNDTSAAIYDNIDEKLTAQKNNGLKLYWIGIGKEDFLRGQVTTFRKKLDSLHFPYIYHESERDHIWSNWRAYMLDFVPMLFKK